MSDRSNLHLIACGGAGINIVSDIYGKLSGLGKSYANVSVRSIDTTIKTIQAHPMLGDTFTRIVSSKLSGNGLDGSGGERANMDIIDEIQGSVKEFMDVGLSNEKNDYYVIVTSASGGSGNHIAAALLKNMLALDYNVIVAAVGDGSNELTLNNTVKTLATFYKVAVKAGAALPVIFYNNTYNGMTTLSTEQGVNDKIAKMLTIISAFISGSVQNIDNQDMINFFKPTNYRTFKIEPGMYSLGIARGELNDENTLLVRTLVKEVADDVKMSIVPRHNKTGIVKGDMADDFDIYPIYLLYRKQVMNDEMRRLKQELESIKRQHETESNEFDEFDDMEDDDGMVL